MAEYAYLVPLFPFLAFLANILAGRRLGKASAWISVAASLAACVLGLSAAWKVAATGQSFGASVPWLKIGSVPLEFGYLLDPLSATLLFVVTVVGTLIQIYSMGYMHGDPRYSRFFAYISLFMSAMLALAIANNYLLFFMAWEVVGLCSYLLIGFWFEKNSAADACKKAFLTTRIGDVGFFLGIMTLFIGTGTLYFNDLPKVAAAHAGSGLLLVCALLIFCGTIGKSAQFPLHVWLPDAMEGPTPVSALIHAATMVAAGVYLLARSFVLFEAAPASLAVVTAIGIITAFMAAFIALTATDIKRVLAYSTISQLGYMVTALGLGGLAPGVFHLMTHAFFKALLFLGAGSVIHGTGTQDLREMGGLWGKMKSTAATFVIAALAIAGLPPLAGFWSKDEILVTALHSGNTPVYYALIAVSFMTSFYMFRLVFLAFFGKPRSPHVHAHESPAVMTLPLWILAAGAVLAGLPGSFFAHHWFQNFLHGTPHGTHPVNAGVMVLSTAVGLAGILTAFVMYRLKPALAEAMGRIFRPLYALSLNKLYFDEIYGALIIRPFHALARALYGFDETVVDGAVNGTAKATMRTSRIKNWIDIYIVDGLVNFTGALVRFASAVLRYFQTGFVQNYMLLVVLGVLTLIVFEWNK